MKCIKMGTVLVSLLLVISFLLSCSKNGDKQPWFEPLGKNADWQPQDYVDSQGIKAVHLEGGRLVLEAHLIGQHPNYNKGEVFLDIRYFPGLEGSVPIDLSQSKITVEVEVPNAFDGWESSPNRVQVFVKDHEWRSQYGTWENITKGGKYKATLSPTTGQIRWGYTEPGFDPTKIRIIGVKFAIGTNSSAIYDGPLYVTKISVKPPLALSPPPDMPAAISSPYGSVPFGEKAYSPDGKMYAREVEPRDHGNIGIFDLITDKRLKIMDVRQHPAGDYPNDLKGLAWSPDSKWLAVMYHHDGGGHISIVNIDTGEELKYITISEWYHYMKFSSDGTKIKADGDILDIR